MQPSICLSHQCYPYGGSGRATDQTPSHALMLATKEEAHTGGDTHSLERRGHAGMAQRITASRVRELMTEAM